MIRLTGDNHIRRDFAEPAGASEGASDDFDLMELFSAALLVIDEALQVLRSNAKARECLGSDNGDGFVRLLGQANAGRSQETRKQIKDSMCTGSRGAILLRPAGPQSLICNVLPIRAAPQACALIVLTPLAGGSPAVVPYLKSLYKLSNAEAEIAAAAASGMDVVQMAQGRQVSIHTLRAQIAAIKAKMGLTRMTEIAVTVGRIEAAVTWL